MAGLETMNFPPEKKNVLYIVKYVLYKQQSSTAGKWGGGVSPLSDFFPWMIYVE